MDQLKEHPQIVELLDTLDKNGLMKEKNEVQSLVSYIGGMEETLTEMLGELQDMRREINLIHNNTLRSKCHTLVEKRRVKSVRDFPQSKDEGQSDPVSRERCAGVPGKRQGRPRRIGQGNENPRSAG